MDTVHVMCECAAGQAFDGPTTIDSNETIFSNWNVCYCCEHGWHASVWLINDSMAPRVCVLCNYVRFIFANKLHNIFSSNYIGRYALLAAHKRNCKWFYCKPIQIDRRNCRSSTERQNEHTKEKRRVQTTPVSHAFIAVANLMVNRYNIIQYC